MRTTRKTTKRRRRRTGLLAGISAAKRTSVTDIATNIGLNMLGVVIGSQATAFLEKRDSVQGTDLLGFDGETSKIVQPLIVSAIGIVGALGTKNRILIEISKGIVLSGGAKLINNLTGKSIVALGESSDADAVIPGIGNAQLPVLPGIGEYQEEQAYYVDENGNVVNGLGEIVYDPQTGEPLQTVNGYEVPGLPTNNDLMASDFVPGQSPIAGTSEFDMSGVDDENFN